MNQEEKYKEIEKLIGEYNATAIKENDNVRLGLARSRCYSDDDSIIFEEFIKENGYYENASVSINMIGADYGWVPSSFCY